jgi:peroxiredoxin
MLTNFRRSRQTVSTFSALLMLLCAALCGRQGMAQDPTQASARSLEGRWEGTVTVNDAAIPFRLDLGRKGNLLQATLFNGEVRQTSTSASFEKDLLRIRFDHYLTRIVAHLQDGQLTGRVQLRNDKEGAGSRFTASRYRPEVIETANLPSIEGLWIVPRETSKGEKSWRLVVSQKGPELSAAILRIDGDTGALTGRWQKDRFVLGHFDASRPLRLEIAPTAEGSLDLLLAGGGPNRGRLTAYRPDVARARGIEDPSNPWTHTTVRDPNELFTFRFPDLDGKLVANTDERFTNKALLVVVTGTWCPNCHDEARYLVELDRQYRHRGLEIVALDFEEPEQQEELTRAKAFVRKYGVEFPYLLAGAPAELHEKIPQALNLNTWPATFFIGRDGRVKAVHAGFAAPASGPFHDQLRREYTEQIERLLREADISRLSAPSETGGR